MTNTINLKKEIAAMAQETGYDFGVLNVNYVATRLNLPLDKETNDAIAKELQVQLVESHVLKGSLV